jgi:HlyD family secretion protein
MSARYKSILKKTVVICLLAGGVAAVWAWYRNPAKQNQIEYKTFTVAKGDITQVVTANGQIAPLTNVSVGCQISGQIKEILVDYNSRVTNGQVIARIDPSTYERNLEQAEAELINAQASLELAQLNNRRAKDLRANDLIPISEYDQTLANLHQAEAVVKIRSAAVQKAKVDLDRTTVYSPVDGLVISRRVDIGQTVAASLNAPTLFQIVTDLSKMEINAMVSEADIGGVEASQKVNFTVDAYPSRTFNGQIRQVRYEPITNQNVVTYTTVVDVNNADLKLRPGMTANASIITAERSSVMRVPNSALRFRPPEGAIVQGNTNVLAGSSSTNRLSVSQADRPGGRPGFPEGMPAPPWMAEGRRPSPDEIQKWRDSLTVEQRQQMDQMRERMRGQFGRGMGMGGDGMGGREGMGMGGGGGFAGFGGGLHQPRQEGPATRVVYLHAKDKSASGKEKVVLKAVTVKTGISDGSYTEIMEGLKEGDIVVTGLSALSLASASPVSTNPSPFSPFGFRPRR